MEQRLYGRSALHIRRNLESAVDTAYRFIYTTKRSINALAPISKLPEDVLLEVFRVHLFSCWEDYRRTTGSPTDILRWCWVTHVCHFWRDAAIRCKSLWTHIVLPQRSLDYLVTVLARSSGLPVHFHACGIFTPVRMSLLQLALSDFSNIASIVFEPGPSHCITAEMETTFIHQLFNRDAPKLTSFKVDCRRNADDPQIWTFRDGLDLPSLKELELTGQPYYVMQRFFRPTLTHLKLSWSHRTQAPLVTDLLKHLSQMPLLESIQVLNWSQRPSNDTPSNHATNRQLQLPRLRYLEVNSAFRALLSSISFPIDTRIAFSIIITGDEDPLEQPIDPDTLLPVFREALRDLAARGSSGANFRPLLSAFLQFRDPFWNEWSRILAWDRTQHGEDGSVYELPQTEADININMADLEHRNAFRALRRFYNTLPLSNLVHLVIRDAQRTCPSAYWTRLVNAVPALEHLDITGSAHALICCLNAIIGDGLDDEDDDENEAIPHAPLPLPLPRLTYLTIGPGGRKPRSGKTRKEFIDVLAFTLRTRFRGAHPIQRLKILWGPPADQDRLEVVCNRWVNQILFEWDPKYPEGEVDHFMDEIMDDSSRASSAEDSESDEET